MSRDTLAEHRAKIDVYTRAWRFRSEAMTLAGMVFHGTKADADTVYGFYARIHQLEDEYQRKAYLPHNDPTKAAYPFPPVDQSD